MSWLEDIGLFIAAVAPWLIIAVFFLGILYLFRFWMDMRKLRENPKKAWLQSLSAEGKWNKTSYHWMNTLRLAHSKGSDGFFYGVIKGFSQVWRLANKEKGEKEAELYYVFLIQSISPLMDKFLKIPVISMFRGFFSKVIPHIVHHSRVRDLYANNVVVEGFSFKDRDGVRFLQEDSYEDSRKIHSQELAEVSLLKNLELQGQQVDKAVEMNVPMKIRHDEKEPSVLDVFSGKKKKRGG